jgi:hypothetical protein
MSNNNSSSNSSSGKQQQQQQQPKVTASSATTTSTNSISTSTISFPDLVESNNSRNKQLSNSLDVTAAVAATVNGDATQTELKSFTFNGGVSGMVFMDSNNNGPEFDRINNNNSQKISYSQSLLESHNQQQQQQQQPTALDANGNAQLVNTVVINTSMPSVKNVLMKSKSVDHNNLSSIEHYPALEKTKQTLSDVLSKPIEVLAGTKKIKQVKNATTTTTPTGLTFVDDGKVMTTKKKASKKHVSTSTSPQSSHETQNNQQQSNSHNRPAVIIMDDNSYDTTVELGITFGFDINEHLLCGHPNGDVTASPPNVVMADDIESSNNANKNTCDIMNTNNLSRNNLSNNYQSIEMYMPTAAGVLVPHTVIFQPSQSSPDNTSCGGLTNNMDSSNDLGYLSSSLHSPPSVVTGTVTAQKLSPNQQVLLATEHDQKQPQERDFALQVTPMEISQQTKFEELKIISLPDFISPPESKNFINYDDVVSFVKEGKNCNNILTLTMLIL